MNAYIRTVRKTSKKRQAIIDALSATYEHPTAEMLYNTLKPEYPELSLGTVYRNLSVLAEEGLVISVGTVAGQERYDARTALHAHFACARCRRVLDLDIPDTVSELYEEIEKDTGCTAISHNLIVTGFCDRCRNENDTPAI